MKRILTPGQMKQAEAASEKLGVSLWKLMRNAGNSLAEIAFEKAEEIGAKSCVILCGSGNNGGDGFVCAERLSEYGLKTEVVLMTGEPKTELAQKAFSMLSGKTAVSRSPEIRHFTADIIIDCIFGTGFHGEFRGDIAEKLTAFGNCKAYKIACDMPSGVDALRGTAAMGTLSCDLTVTFHAAKLGMMLSPAHDICGEIVVSGIGIPEGWDKFIDDKTRIIKKTSHDLHCTMPRRPEYSHKGTFGKLLMICGCESYIGAAAICSRAALHTGCGIVNLAAPEAVISAIAGHAPECVYTPLPTDGEGYISEMAVPKLIELSKNHDAVVIGCGLGQAEGTAKIVEAMVKSVESPLLIDADGINLLAKNIDVLKDKCPGSEIILTPHIAELSRLCGTSTADASARRYELCREFTDKYGVTLHSKDASSVTFRDEDAFITDFGCSALAKGGSGDMLAGIIGSLLAQGKDPLFACALGDYIMGKTAEILCEKLSPAAVTATDIISAFKETLTGL